MNAMKLIFAILSALTDRNAMESAARCCLTSAITSVAALFLLGMYQALRYSSRSGDGADGRSREEQTDREETLCNPTRS